MNAAQTLSTIGAELNATHYERRAVIEAMTLGVLAHEHVFVLGQPGSGKSALIRDFLGRIVGASVYEQLLSKSRPDFAILGPYDLLALKQGVFRRQREGYLLTADFAFLDEIGKMSQTTGHDLLLALNERKRHEVDGGTSVHPIPLHTAMTASNELPAGESEDAAALWDRLLVRVHVDYIQEQGNFAKLLASAVNDPFPAAAVTTIDFADLASAVHEHVPMIPIPTGVIDAVMELRTVLRAGGIVPSDRRWRKSMRLLQAAAFMAERDKVEIDDLAVLRFSLWESPEQRITVERAALKIANPLNEQAMQILDSVMAVRNEVKARSGKSLKERTGYGVEALAKLENCKREGAKLRQKCLNAGRSTTGVDEVLTELKTVRSQVMKECLDVDEEERS